MEKCIKLTSDGKQSDFALQTSSGEAYTFDIIKETKVSSII